MDGFDDRTYGERFADVYDDWYADVSDVDATVATVLELAGGRPVLELGVGTGRLAIPIATAGAGTGVAVSGVDTSPAMLDRLRASDPDALVAAHLGDMIDDLPGGPFGVVLVAYNTLFNLSTLERQRRCFAAVASVLDPDGAFVVEAFVPADDPDAGTSEVAVRSMTADRVVLSVSIRDPDEQTAEGQFVEFRDGGGVRLRPWSIRYATPGQLDEMADAAGLRLDARWSGFEQGDFDPGGSRHVSVYRPSRSS